MTPDPPPAVPEVDQDWDLRVKRELERDQDREDRPTRHVRGPRLGDYGGQPGEDGMVQEVQQ
jgi:hypothetical protein